MCSFAIKLITVPVIADPQVASDKGKTDHNLEELCNCHFYTNNQVTRRVDVNMIITKSSSVGESGSISSNPKLLLLRFHSMMKSSLTDAEVEEIF